MDAVRYTKRSEALTLVWTLFIERIISAPFFVYIIYHTLRYKAGMPRKQFNMIIFGDVVRMGVVLYLCIKVHFPKVDFDGLGGESNLYYVNEICHEWRNIWELSVIAVLFKYLFLPFRRVPITKMRYLTMISVIYVTLYFGITLAYNKNVLKKTGQATNIMINNIFGYSLVCDPSNGPGHGSKNDTDDDILKIISTGFLTLTSCVFFAAFMLTLVVGLQCRKMRHWVESHHLNTLLLFVMIFSLLTFPENIIYVTVMKFPEFHGCNMILLVCNVIASLRVLLDIGMWFYCAKFQYTIIDIEKSVDMSGISGQSTDDTVKQPLLAGGGRPPTSTDTTRYPSADAYFMERVYSFMRTAILTSLEDDKLSLEKQSDNGKEKTLCIQIDFEGTDITGRSLYPRQFQKLREHNWGIRLEDYIASFEPEVPLYDISFGRDSNVQFLTKDKKYIIKSTSKAELYNLESMFEEYMNYTSSHSNTFLIRITGAYQIKLMKFQPKINVIIFENPFYDIIPDLGYSISTNPPSRRRKIRYKHVYAKTIPFYYGCPNVRVQAKKHAAITSILDQDVRFLKNNECTGYNLLLLDCDGVTTNMDNITFYGLRAENCEMRAYKICLVNILLPFKCRTIFRKRRRAISQSPDAYAKNFLRVITDKMLHTYYDEDSFWKTG